MYKNMICKSCGNRSFTLINIEMSSATFNAVECSKCGTVTEGSSFCSPPNFIEEGQILPVHRHCDICDAEVLLPGHFSYIVTIWDSKRFVCSRDCYRKAVKKLVKLI